MKTYCKPAEINIESLDFIKEQVHLCFTGKRSKRRFQNLLVSTGKITRAELREANPKLYLQQSLTAIDAVAEQAHADILTRSVSFEPVRQFQLRETGSCATSARKARGSRFLSTLQRERLTLSSARSCCRSSTEVCPEKGRLPGNGRTSESFAGCSHNKTDAAKCDVKKAYPSTTVECVMNLLRRDIGKNKPLLWLVEAVMANYRTAFC